MNYSKTFLKRPLKSRPKIGFQDRLSLHADQKYLQNAAILSTFIKLLLLRPLFCLFLSGCFRQVLLYNNFQEFSIVRDVKLLYTGNLSRDTLANSENQDEMPQNAAKRGK